MKRVLGVQGKTRAALAQTRKHLADVDWIMAISIALIGLAIFWAAPVSAKGYAIASSVALFIAFVAYPWQKERDRTNELRREQREAYRLFLGRSIALEASFSALDFSDATLGKRTVEAALAAKRDYEFHLRELMLTASPSVLDEAIRTHETLYRATERLMAGFQEFIDSEAETHEAKAVENRMGPVVKAVRAEFMAAENALRKAMRSEEFGVIGEYAFLPRNRNQNNRLEE